MADKLSKLPFPNDPSVTKEQNKTNQLLQRRHYDVSIILPAPPRRKRCGLARWRHPTPGNLLAVDEHDDFQASHLFARVCASAITGTRSVILYNMCVHDVCCVQYGAYSCIIHHSYFIKVCHILTHLHSSMIVLIQYIIFYFR